MGSPVSPIVANLFMESFEKDALETARNPSSLWLRYVDDTMTKIHSYHIFEFSEHLNTTDPHIKFTSEKEEVNKIPFLDTCALFRMMVVLKSQCTENQPTLISF